MGDLLSTNFALTINTYTPAVFFITLCILIVIILLFFKQRNDAIIFTIAFFATGGIVLIMKHVFAVPRPEQALIKLTDYAFPSSHAALAMFFAVMIGWLLTRHFSIRKRISVPIQGALFLPALMVGVSRLTIGVHTPFQVLVGFLIGILVPLCVIYGERYLMKR